MRRISLAAASVTLAVAMAACDQNAFGPGGAGSNAPPEMVVSDALAGPGSVNANGVRSSVSVSAATFAYVCAAPGTFSTSASVAVLRNQTRNGTEQSIQLLNGGFDPAGIEAVDGDELSFSVFINGVALTPVIMKVPPRRPPEVVRTHPQKGRTDVALNVQVFVVFSEPVNKGTVTPSSVRLMLDGNPVNGTVRVKEDGLSAEFLADNPLQPLKTYTLVVTRAVLDLSGDALDAISTVTFTTEAAAPTGTLAFVSERDGNSEIYIVRTDGTGLVRLTNNAGSDFDPAWSPDGSRIAFTSDRDGGSNIYVMNADGSNVVRRTTAGGLQPAWSPDGGTIAFTRSLGGGGTGIATLTSDGALSSSGLGRVPGVNSDAAWSPDGRKIAFVNASDYTSDVLVVNADGSGTMTQLMVPYVPYRTTSYPAWSPGGARMAVIICDYDMVRNVANFDPCHSKLALVNLDGPGFTILWLTGDVPLHGGVAAPLPKPTWSPDGRTLAVTSACSSGSCPPSISYVSAEGIMSRVIVSNGHSPSWRP